MMNETSIFQWLFRSAERKEIIESFEDNNQLCIYIIEKLFIWAIIIALIKYFFEAPFNGISWLSELTLAYTVWELVPLLIYTKWLSTQDTLGVLLNLLVITSFINYSVLSTEYALNNFFSYGMLLSLSLYAHIGYLQDVDENKTKD